MGIRGWTGWVAGIAWLLLALQAGANIRTGFEPHFVNTPPIDTWFTDSRFQFVIPQAEIRISPGETLTGLRLFMTSGIGSMDAPITIRVKAATPVDLDSLATGRFVNGGLFTLYSSQSYLPSTEGWVSFPGLDFMLIPGRDLLVDLVLDHTNPGSDTYWLMSPASSPSVYRGLNDFSPSFNLLGYTLPGAMMPYRPAVILEGLERQMPPLVLNSSQLLDPSGLIEADWKVENTACVIQPGIELPFGEGFGLQVYNDLTAIGAEEDSIRFIGNNWTGIQANLGAGNHLELDHCVFENPGGYYSLLLNGQLEGTLSTVRNTVVRGTGRGPIFFGAPVEVQGLRVSECGTGMTVESTDHFTLSQIILDNNYTGLEIGNLTGDAGSVIRDLLVTRSTWRGIMVWNSSARIENATLADNYFVAMEANGDGVMQLMNCVFANPYGEAELWTDMGSMTVAVSYGSLYGGLVRCSQRGGTYQLFDNHLFTGDPMLDASYHPLPGSPLIDSGNPLSPLDPDLTRADRGYHFFDQRAPQALSATDVPEDQGGRLQLVWNASSMDLAQASDPWFYSVWRLDTLFSAGRSALPVVHSRRAAEAAMAEGRPFTWQRDGAAWNWLGSVPAARFAQYALVVETLADRLGGQPWQTPLKVLWHAGDVLAESAVVSGTSVDNVPPDAPLAVASVPGSGTLRLAWQPVTTGTVNGQALAERNGVVYHVYEIPAPYAPPGSGTFLGTTTEPEFLLPLPTTASQRFFRVEADDVF